MPEDFIPRLIPIVANAKVPPNGFTYTQYHDRPPTDNELRQWADNYPTATNRAALMGKPSDTVGLDVDAKYGGLDTIKKYAIPRTRTVRSPHGGLHYYFRYPTDGCPSVPVNALGEGFEGLEVKSDGTYILQPGSIVGGRPYELVLDEPRAEMPEWLLQAVRGYERKRRDGESEGRWRNVNGPVGKGEQDNTLISIAGTMAACLPEPLWCTIEPALADATARWPQNPGDPWTDENFRRIADSARKMEREKRAAKKTGAIPDPGPNVTIDEIATETDRVLDEFRRTQDFTFRRDGAEDFVFTFRDRARVVVRRVHEYQRRLVGEVTVEHPLFGRLRFGDLTFMSTDSRAKWVKALKDKTTAIEWERHLDDVCATVSREFRKSEPDVAASEIPDVPFRLSLRPFVPMDETTMLYGPRGTGKSVLAVAIGASLISGVTLPGPMTPLPEALGTVVYLDYETSRETFKRRLTSVRLALGLDADIETSFRYRRLLRPLPYEADTLLTPANRHDVRTWIIDSWRYACGSTGTGDPADAAVAAFEVLRRLPGTKVAIAHPPKEGGSVYGTVFNENVPRSIAEIRRVGPTIGLTQYLVIEHRKANDIMPYEPVGIAFRYAPSTDPEDQPRLVEIIGHDFTYQQLEGETNWDRIKRMLERYGQSTTKVIATTLRMSEAAVRMEMSRRSKEVESKPQGRESLWSLKGARSGPW